MFAAELGVSRGVVVEAYEQLIAEGYLVATRGGATRVASTVRRPPPPREEPRPQTFAFDFRPGLPDMQAFPWNAWWRASRTALDAVDGALAYPDPRGILTLRAALAEYLTRARGVAASASQIIICTGCAQGLSIAARTLKAHGIERLATEDLGNPDIRGVIAEGGVTPVSVPVDEDGLDVSALERLRVKAVVLSPAHQNPLGSVLSPARRQQLLAWAFRVGGFIVEDDYDAEYRYDRAAIGALQGLAPERVIYLGSASKILAPGLRLGWMVLDDAILETASRVKRHLDYGSAAMEQLAYAEFIASGELDRHLRRMRHAYRRRRDVLLAALAKHFPDWTVRGAAAGLHVALQPPPGTDVAALVARAAARSVRLYPLSAYMFRYRIPDGLVFGYACLSEAQIDEAIRRIAPGRT